MIKDSKAKALEFRLGTFILAEDSKTKIFNGVNQDNFIRSPENFLGRPYGGPADMWGLGVTVCQFLTNEGVFCPSIEYSDEYVVSRPNFFY